MCCYRTVESYWYEARFNRMKANGERTIFPRGNTYFRIWARFMVLFCVIAFDAEADPKDDIFSSSMRYCWENDIYSHKHAHSARLEWRSDPIVSHRKRREIEQSKRNSIASIVFIVVTHSCSEPFISSIPWHRAGLFALLSYGSGWSAWLKRTMSHTHTNTDTQHTNKLWQKP